MLKSLKSMLASNAVNYPNVLAAPEPHRATFARRYGLLTILVFLCLIPRVWMAAKLDSICPDGVLYITAANALEQGDLRVGLRDMHLNTYPVILTAMHQLAIPWDLTGKIWNVVISSLLVLPLYGWVRRQFDDRLALVACLLYAVHGQFILWAPETIRDPTFWFLFTWALYLLWRAAVEVRPSLYWLAGGVMTLASMTRIEGLFLVIPFFFWSFWRFLALRQDRRRLLFGVLACLSVAPSLIVLVNLTLLHHHSQWEFARLSPIQFVEMWLRAKVGVWTGVAAPSNVAAPVGATTAEMVRCYFPAILKGVTPVHGLLLLAGLWIGRRVWWRRDQQPLFYTALVFLASIWIHLWVCQSTCPRYLLPIVIMAAPFAALAVLRLNALVLWCGQWWSASPVGVRAATVSCWLAIAVAGLAPPLVVQYPQRNAEVELGRWIESHFGPSSVLAGSNGCSQVVAYYGQAKCVGFAEVGPADVVAALQASHPDTLLLVCTRRQDYRLAPDLSQRLESLGFQRFEDPGWLGGCPHLLVFVRQSPADRVARGPRSTPGS